ncbi:hypothetical protein OC846_002886 [Tilletia horrida]|uniref:Uncharacterized protein n=1 Tax=Tilletia horrida TaxID=155126 RepID=A0AAN6JYH0_9BASI|nr:hypothetical protein OC846_002886 [Tilletia horrida]
MTNDVHIDFERINSSAHSHMLKIKIRGMSLRVHRFAFAFTAKKGIKFHDHGIADLTVGGFGLSITIEIPRDRGEHYFFVRKCKAKLEELKFHIRKSNHRILHAMASGITNSYPTRKILSLIIGRGIGLGLKQLDLALMQAHLERERLRREGIQQKTEISVDELRSRVATIRDLMQKYHESAGTFRIDFDPSEDPKNEKGWEDAHAVKWIKETIEKTGAQDVKVHEWRSTAFGADDPFLAQHGEQKEDGHAARMAAKLQQLASKAATAAAKTDKKQDTNESQGVVPQSDAVDEAAIQKAENDLTALQNTADQEGEATHMESEAGKKAERRHSDVSDQVKELEKAVDKATS